MSDESGETGRSAGAKIAGSGRGGLRSWTAWSLAALWTGWAAGRALGLDGLTPFEGIAVPLVSLTPYLAAAAPLPVVAALLLRRPRAALVAGLAALALGVSLLPRATADATVEADGPKLRVLTSNVFFGRASMAELVRIVERERVDVLSLQEFTPDAESGLDEQGLRALLPHKAADPRWGAGGSALYSRYPLTALPALPGTVMAHPRAALEVDGRRIEVTAVHPLPPIRGEGLADWKHSLATLPPAGSGTLRILAGDFNATFDHARFRDLLDRGYSDAADRRGEGLTTTWGFSDFPRLTLDHILVPRTVAVRSYDVLRLSGSDHRPVLAELQLP
ncbi:endonuclease/exonuclease/phosphatase family protein [Actinocorallia populi]|uniref:endonuclease/exonuclease/phosphatase family protein n=1 Tax=Actinocorallia populi TaxID=2079200 RepID=UPI001300188B|nr:endonuclease/exonuclease/phosphatase family protein [Actinocorallia populi]